MEINRYTINKYCNNAEIIQRFFEAPERWSGPFPPDIIPVNNEKIVNFIESIRKRLPIDYAERLIFTHTIQKTVNDSLFPWINFFSEDILYFEVMLHMEPEQEYYRDHYAHPLEVACIGEQLLEVDFGGITLGEKILESFKKIAECNVTGDHSGLLQNYILQCNIKPGDINQDWLKAAWWLSALYHDIGYFIQKSWHLLDEKMHRSFPFGWNRIITGWNKQEMGDELVWKQVEAWVQEKNPDIEYYNYFKSFEPGELLTLMAKEDHPAIGALSLSALSKKMLQHKSLTPLMFCAFQVASHAIFCHDHTGLAECLRKRWDEKTVDKPIYHMNYWDNPLAALLIISDHISEFNRERLEPVKSRIGKKVSFNSVFLCKSVKIDIDGKCMNISFEHEKDMKKKLFSKHFIEDKQWFLPCSSYPEDRSPYLKLDKNVFDILVKLPINKNR